MGFRFQRRVKVLPGVDANLSKGGVSVSIGPKGLKTSIGKNGIKTSVGIPGTGIRYEMPWGGRSDMDQLRTTEAKSQDNGGTDGRSRTTKIDIDESQLDYYQTLKRCAKNKKNLKCFRAIYIVVAILGLLSLAVATASGSISWPIWGVWLVFMAIVLTIDVLFSKRFNREEQVALNEYFRHKHMEEEIAYREEAKIRAEQARQWAEKEEKREKEREAAKQRAKEARLKEVDDWVERCAVAGGLVTITSNVPCKRGEGVIFEEDGISLWETRKVREKGGRSSDHWMTIDTGKMVVTNKRVLFLGEKGNRTILSHDIVNMTAYADAIDVSSIKREKAMRFSCRNSLLLSTILRMIQKSSAWKLVPPSAKSTDWGKEPDERKTDTTSLTSPEVDEKSDCGEGVSSGYLELVQDATEAVGAFVGELSEDEDVESLLQRIEGIDGVETMGLFATKNPKLGFLVAEDVMKCIAGLGYQWDNLGDAEAAGIWLALSQVVRFSEAPVGDWNDRAVRDTVRQSLAAFPRRLQEAVPLAFDGDEFLFNFVLSNGDDSKGYGRRFATLMYRWASIVAKADGVVTPEESAFLAKIVTMGGVTDAAPVSTGKVKADPVVSKPMRDLEKMVGLEVVKEEVSKLANLVRVQQERARQGIKAVSVSYHCVFTGNPGTGKTTVARIVAGIYKDLGVLKKGHLVETDRAGLVAEYVGQTGPKTNKVVDSALDGVLFIDEAYSLVEGGQNDYGKEAVATLLKRMEDDRARLVVILAGYGENMKRFIESNPGLQSRFNRYIEFPDYGAADLVEIFKRFAKGSQYRLGAGAEGALRGVMEEAVAHKDEQFGNGRFARNVFEKAIERQAMRLAGVGSLTKEMLQELLPEDIVGA